MPERNLDPHVSQWVVQALSRLLATYAIVQGFFIVIGGRERWQGPSFVTALSIPGAPESWGVALFLLGIAALGGTFRPRPRLVWPALTAIGAWALFFTAVFVINLITTPGSATTGIVTYGFVAVLSGVLAAAYRQSVRR